MLLQLGRRSREATSSAQLGFMAVNETHMLAPYRQAALWIHGQGVVALSGVVSPEANAPYVQWLADVFALQGSDAHTSQARALGPADLPAALGATWSEWLPACGLLLPFSVPGVQLQGCLLLVRDEPWLDAEMDLLGEWVGIWSQPYAVRRTAAHRMWQGFKASLRQGQWLPRLSDRGWKSSRFVLTAAVLLVLMLPVRLTVLAPAELVPLNPSVIRAAMDGVVGKVLVQPNQKVALGDPLFEFDRASLESRLQIARSSLDTVQAEYRQKSQRALFDPDSRAQLAVLQGPIEEKSTEVAYLHALNSRGLATSPRAGVVLFGDPTEWVGRPVVTGERVMVVADEQAVEIEAWLSPGDAIALPLGSSVRVYLNANPLSPVDATLRYVAHEAVERPDGHFAYRIRATLAPGQFPRVGLKGTAKLDGERVLLLYWVIRKPLAALRAWVGL
ncbi:efflux RND transporter periplasmic adaptor subunit [Hydrogenophaga taeniospiralis]|uniref:efflux RND transporter periplasmic adaptor subunit n=1 Tax=Hydrogenophaga taeniospiralis TaxID=65656 RepID=UPI001CF97A25|nr:HlyD family efflux transporter periplasmic adaptor subunit [Hydrogenophaga taeniospiralis]UCU92300.1 HlyD family efflux transporter periplasmic adaptor subunit [Hydrogenophaga taeniospiralis]